MIERKKTTTTANPFLTSVWAPKWRVLSHSLNWVRELMQLTSPLNLVLGDREPHPECPRLPRRHRGVTVAQLKRLRGAEQGRSSLKETTRAISQCYPQVHRAQFPDGRFPSWPPCAALGCMLTLGAVGWVAPSSWPRVPGFLWFCSF